MKNLMIFMLSLIVLTAGVGAINILPGSSKSSSIDSEGLLLGSSKLQDILKQEAESVGSGDIPVIVQFYGSLSSSQKSELLGLGRIKYEYSIIDATALSLDVLNLDELASLVFVKYVEYDADTRIVLAQSATQTGASRVWLDYNAKGEGVKIAILDTGIDDEHPDVQNVAAEQDFTGEGTDDRNGHGTHVASIAAGTGAASGGINKGVAPGASLMDIKVLDGTGSGKLSDAIAGIEWAVLNDADIISMSLGSEIPCNGLDAASLAADAAVKRGKHVVVAAGNLGPLPGTIGSPGCARNVITVGAVDRLDNMAAFSSRGPTLDGRTKPDIVAPGVLIIAANSGGGYAAKSGTSMATPHISGVVALILGENHGLLPEQVKEVLMDTALDLGEDANAQGAGRVKAYEAFTEATGLEPREQAAGGQPDEDAGRENAERKSKDEGYVDKVESVKEKDENGKEYYVVEGKKQDSNKVVRVWVDKGTGQIEKVESMSPAYRIILYVVEFFEYLGSKLHDLLG